jgi:hypothetical protein
LTVTDAFNRGDSFSVFDNGTLVGTTPTVTGGGTCGTNPATCLADPTVSHAVFTLGAGSHSITITLNTTVGAGAAYLRVDAAATSAIPALSLPVLAGLAMALAALGTLFGFRHANRSQPGPRQL